MNRIDIEGAVCLLSVLEGRIWNLTRAKQLSTIDISHLNFWVFDIFPVFDIFSDFDIFLDFSIFLSICDNLQYIFIHNFFFVETLHQTIREISVYQDMSVLTSSSVSFPICITNNIVLRRWIEKGASQKMIFRCTLIFLWYNILAHKVVVRKNH